MATIDRLEEVLDGYPNGVHRLGDPCVLFDAAMPEVLADLYCTHDGLELFFGALVIAPSASVRQVDGVWRIGEVDGDDLFVTDAGAVEIAEKDTGERLREGSRLDRWLLGWAEAQSLLFENDGEYRDDVFEESGDVVAEVQVRMLRRILKRDPGACAPRWRMARALSRRGADDDARDQLEQVVERFPDFGWAWYDLGRISERLGHPEAATDELEAAGDADPDYEHAPFFWAHAARLAAASNDEARRAELAARALSRAPDLARAQREAARHELDAGEPDVAGELIDVAAALAPRDLAVIDLRKAIAAARGSSEQS